MQFIAAAVMWLMERRAIAALLTGIGYLFKTQIGLIIVSGLAWLGLNFATVKLVVDPALDLMYGYMQAGPSGGNQYAAVAMQWMGVLNLDKAVTMIGSAILIKQGVMKGRLFLFKKGFGAKP